MSEGKTVRLSFDLHDTERYNTLKSQRNVSKYLTSTTDHQFTKKHHFESNQAYCSIPLKTGVFTYNFKQLSGLFILLPRLILRHDKRPGVTENSSTNRSTKLSPHLIRLHKSRKNFDRFGGNRALV